MKRYVFPAIAAVGAITAFVGAGCGSSKGPSGFTGAGDGGGGRGDDGSGGMIFGDSGDFGDGLTTGAGCSPLRCSSDLHSVLDCAGNLVKQCQPDQGCGGADCVPACDSARVNKSTIGCDYYSVDPQTIAAGNGACFAAFIANTWTSPVTIAVERAGQSLDVSGFARIPSGSGQSISYAPLPGGQLPPGQVAILFLARSGTALVNCPMGIKPAFTSGLANVTGTGMGDAFHITSTAPVVAYDIFPYGGGQSAATSATLLLPTSAWDTNYIGVNAYRKSTFVPEAQPTLDIVAAEDGTTVTISPTAAIVAGAGVAAAAKGTPTTYNLKKGQILQFTQDAELTGSPIQSNKPVGVWGGATCLNVDVGKQACDSAHQQIPPVKALGHEYVAVRYRERFDGSNEAPPWRFVGAVDGTKLTYEPSMPPGAPTTLAVGQVAEFRSPGPYVVKSQDDMHPFYMSAYMTGAEEVNPSLNDGRGDPEFVNVIPAQEYLDSYVFFTDPTYPETNLVLVRVKAKDGFKDVTLDCAGKLANWMPVGSGGAYEYTRIDLVRHNFAKQGSCDNGRHEIKSDAPFGLTVWGWGSAETGGIFGIPGTGFYSQAVSYAYPAGASVQPINTVVVPPTPR